MRVLVCGGRDFKDKELLTSILDTLHGLADPFLSDNRIHCIIHGGASGADQMAERWAVSKRIPSVEKYEADWKKYGRSAGPIRNLEMITKGKPDLVVAFPGGRGTANMMTQARKHGIQVREF